MPSAGGRFWWVVVHCSGGAEFSGGPVATILTNISECIKFVGILSGTAKVLGGYVDGPLAAAADLLISRIRCKLFGMRHL